MNKEIAQKWVLEITIDVKRRIGRLCSYWEDEVVRDVQVQGVRNETEKEDYGVFWYDKQQVIGRANL